jgi:G3E family GTPase
VRTQGKVPVTVITGALGSGKTTLLNHLLSRGLPEATAVIVNEFGPISVDAQLVEGVDEEILEINNGCICCTVRNDLVTTISRLLDGSRPIERILIETTGLADPAPVIQSFVLDPMLSSRTTLDGIVTVVDVRHNALWLGQQGETENPVREQIAFADVLLLNKCDLVDEEDLLDCRRTVHLLNPLARVHAIEHGRVDPALVLGIGAFDLRHALALEPRLLEDLDHAHAEDIQGLVVRPASDLDAEPFFGWLNRFVRERGQDLLRMKGIVALRGDARRYVFHAVHMTLDGRPGRPWAADARQGEIVLIGRRLDLAAIQADVDSCVVDPVPA